MRSGRDGTQASDFEPRTLPFTPYVPRVPETCGSGPSVMNVFYRINLVLSLGSSYHPEANQEQNGEEEKEKRKRSEVCDRGGSERRIGTGAKGRGERRGLAKGMRLRGGSREQWRLRQGGLTFPSDLWLLSGFLFPAPGTTMLMPRLWGRGREGNGIKMHLASPSTYTQGPFVWGLRIECGGSKNERSGGGMCARNRPPKALQLCL